MVIIINNIYNEFLLRDLIIAINILNFIYKIYFSFDYKVISSLI